MKKLYALLWLIVTEYDCIMTVSVIEYNLLLKNTTKTVDFLVKMNETRWLGAQMKVGGIISDEKECRRYGVDGLHSYI